MAAALAAPTLGPAAAAEPLRATETEQLSPSVQHVLITGFAQRADAESAARMLERHGIGARPIAIPQGYALVAGEFGDIDALFARLRALERLGFDHVYVVHGPADTDLGTAAAEEPSLPYPGDGERLVFGAPGATTPTPPRRQRPAIEADLPRSFAESGRLLRADAPADSITELTVTPRLRWRPDASWEMQAEARLDAVYQSGAQQADRVALDYGDSFVRYRNGFTRITVGTQTIVWGRMDALSPLDRLSTKDLRRFGLDDLPERRLPSPALRIELFPGDLRIDAVFLPVFREAALPQRDSIWHPVDRRRGVFLGQPADPSLGVLIREGSFDEGVDGSGGGGLRLTREGRALDLGVTLQRVRHSAPYYALDEQLRQTLLATGDVQLALEASEGPTFTARHPWTSVAGLEFGLDTGTMAWRGEAAYLSAVPATSEALAFTTRRGVDWAVGADAFTGDADTRISLELAGRHLLQADRVLDRRRVYLIGGEIAHPLRRHTYLARLRFSAGLDRRDWYLNPELAYIGISGQQLFLGFHYFDGVNGTAGGFLQRRDLLVLGWRGRF